MREREIDPIREREREQRRERGERLEEKERMERRGKEEVTVGEVSLESMATSTKSHEKRTWGGKKRRKRESLQSWPPDGLSLGCLNSFLKLKYWPQSF